MKKIFILVAMAWSNFSYGVNSISDNLLEAERSPLFQQKFNSASIQAKGLRQITLHNGVKLEFKKYTELTRLDRNEKFQPLMNQRMVSRYLRSKPTYTENIIQLQDRLIVDRTMNVSMKKGVCKQTKLPLSVKELCFVSKQGVMPKETKSYLVNLRRKLKTSQPSRVVKNGYTAKQLSAMGDSQLLDILLNSDDRKIQLVSVLPTKVYNNQIKQNLWNVNKRFANSNFANSKNTQLAKFNMMTAIPQSNNKARSKNKVFPKKYFLTGFTLGREMSDTFEIQLAGSTLFTDRYYLQFSYVIRAGFGLRFPFSVSTSSKAIDSRFERSTLADQQQTQVTSKPKPIKRGRNRLLKSQRLNISPQVLAGKTPKSSSSGLVNKVAHAEISMSVAPVDVDVNGFPAYQAVGLPKNKYFKGKEFVLELYATCHFKASIPGKDINKDCPVFDENRSRDIKPFIGNEKHKLATLWIEGTATGLGLNVWAGSVRLDLGIEANLTNGRIGFNAFGFNQNLIDDKQTKPLLFKNRDIQKFTIKNTRNVNALFQLNSPYYGFDFELLPVVRAKLKLDLGIKSFNKTLGPYSIDALSLSIGLNLGHHEGTVKSHLYNL